MRTLCDVCESGAAILFCAADEAALCASCDQKVHMCNKLANRHVRVGLADPSDVLRCDICENGPAFFYCEIDGSSLCLQCDMTVHVGGKRKHGRYLMLRQRVEFPEDKAGSNDELRLQPIDPSESRRESNYPFTFVAKENQQNQRAENHQYHRVENQQYHRIENQQRGVEIQQYDRTFTVPGADFVKYGRHKMDTSLIDLNAPPRNVNGQTSNNQFLEDKVGSNDELRLQPIGPSELRRESNYPFTFVAKENQQNQWAESQQYHRVENQQYHWIENQQRGVEIQQYDRTFTVPGADFVNNGRHKMATSLIDLNGPPRNVNGQTSNNQWW